MDAFVSSLNSIDDFDAHLRLDNSIAFLSSHPETQSSGIGIDNTIRLIRAMKGAVRAEKLLRWILDRRLLRIDQLSSEKASLLVNATECKNQTIRDNLASRLKNYKLTTTKIGQPIIAIKPANATTPTPTHFSNPFRTGCSPPPFTALNCVNLNPPKEKKKFTPERLRPTPTIPTASALVPLADLLQRVQEKNFEGLLPGCLENHLSDADFKEIFKISRIEFQQMPRWKQIETKKRAGLF